ncbi:TPA: translation initiation factor IF-2 [Candidatus Poribacteria bacterium]|nr:translation initiation factor IF-2 [Candidatus Poribacteria bacterium]HEX29884.1 translation initiation factor IF-2 [Candidatus Poribacteria bacterium]
MTRVYELARKLGISSKEMIEELKKYGVDIKTHMSTLDPETVELVIAEFEDRRAQEEREDQSEPISVRPGISVGELADLIGADPADVITELLKHGVMANVNQKLDTEAITLISDEFNLQVRDEEEAEVEVEGESPEDEEEEEALQPRPPVVTVMGHVDHGKTTLLDTIRRTNVTQREFGGITQHIGASVVTHDGRKIVFIDTPGHEAFTAMRARGAQVTDIVVLVVAADDGVMPQTVEAIDHARAANVPIIVAVNKIDLPEARPDRVRQQLSEHGLVPEEWGGETICVDVSAKRGDGVEDLLEMILLLADLLELKANPDKPARGIVIEARLDKGKGPVATVLVQEGTLRVGDSFIVGLYDGKVRAMTDDKGKRVKEAGPSIPVEIMGINGVPEAGDKLVVMGEEEARKLSEQRQEEHRLKNLGSRKGVSLDEFFSMMREEEEKKLLVILKGDTQGTVEAVSDALMRLQERVESDIQLDIIHRGVGSITESDVMLASASGGIIIGFNVRPSGKVAKLAEGEGVEIRTYRVIYELLSDMRDALLGMLEPEEREIILGRAEVRQVFSVPRFGRVAGCYVLEGRMVRGRNLRVIRDGVLIYEGKLDSLRRFRDDVREVQEGFECGIGMESFSDFKEGDILECFTVELVRR